MSGINFGESPSSDFDGDLVCLKYSPDGKWLAIVLHNYEFGNIIKIYDVNSNLIKATLNAKSTLSYLLSYESGQQKNIKTISFSHDSKFLVTGCDKGSIWIWDITLSKIRKKWLDYNSKAKNIEHLAYNSDSSQLIAADSQHAFVFDIKLGKYLKSFSLAKYYTSDNSSISCPEFKTFNSGHAKIVKLWFQNNKPIILSLIDDKQVVMAELGSDKYIQKFKGHKEKITRLIINQSCDHFISQSSNFAKLWDINTGKCLKTFSYNAEILALNDAGNLIVSRQQDSKNKVQLENLKSREILQVFQARSTIERVAFDYINKRISAIIKNNFNSSMITLYLWKIETISSQQKKIMNLLDNKQYVVSISRNFLANDKVNLIDVNTGNQIQSFEQGKKKILCAALNQSNTLLATAGLDKKIHVWDIKTAKLVILLVGHIGAVSAVAFCEDKLVSAGHDKSLKLWDISTGDIVNSTKLPSWGVTSLSFCKKSNTILFTGKQKVWLWNLGENKTATHGDYFFSDSTGFTAIAADDEYHYVALGNSSGGLQIENNKTNKFLQLIKNELNKNCVICGPWNISKQEGNQLIKSIYKDSNKKLNYNLTGNQLLSKGFFGLKNPSYNCLTWCEKQLSALNINAINIVLRKQQHWADCLITITSLHLKDQSDIKSNQLFLSNIYDSRTSLVYGNDYVDLDTLDLKDIKNLKKEELKSTLTRYSRPQMIDSKTLAIKILNVYIYLRKLNGNSIVKSLFGYSSSQKIKAANDFISLLEGKILILPSKSVKALNQGRLQNIYENVSYFLNKAQSNTEVLTDLTAN